MKRNQELDAYKKMDVKALNDQKSKLAIEVTQKVSLLAESGKKNSLEIRNIRKNIARIETLKLQKLDEQIAKDEVKNAK